MLRTLGFVLGVMLLLLNVLGLSLPNRSSELVNETATYFVDDLKYDADEFYDRLANLDVTDRHQYLISLTQLVSDSLLHYWRNEHQDEYRIRIPWSENYLLRAMSYIDPKFFEMYEFQDHHRAIARGVGLCSQHAIITTAILREQGIDARLVELQGHVILTAEVDEGQWWLLDPDYGLVIPFSLDNAQEHPNDVAQLYADAGFSDYDVDKVEEWFATPDNIIYDGGAERYNPYVWWVENISYAVKWWIPILMMFPAFMWAMTHQRFLRQMHRALLAIQQDVTAKWRWVKLLPTKATNNRY